MLVVIVGNTRSHLGWFEGERLVRSERLLTREAPWNPAFQPEPGMPVGLVSVVPEAARKLGEAWAAVDPVLLASEDAPLPLAYETPLTLGADRVANAVALHARFGRPAIAVDLGTATCLTVVGEGGAILGGAIAPGLDTSHAALVERTAQLPVVDLVDPGVPWGRSTRESIQLGLVAGHAGMVRSLVDRMRAALGPDTPVVLTGGGARVLAPLLPDYLPVPDLTLEGGRLWLAQALGRSAP